MARNIQTRISIFSFYKWLRDAISYGSKKAAFMVGAAPNALGCSTLLIRQLANLSVRNFEEQRNNEFASNVCRAH